MELSEADKEKINKLAERIIDKQRYKSSLLGVMLLSLILLVNYVFPQMNLRALLLGYIIADLVIVINYLKHYGTNNT